MPTYRFLMVAEFESQAQAQDMMNQARARATNTRVVGMGGPGERTSYARLDAMEGTTPTLLDMWYVDIFGIVRNGQYVAPPQGQYPAWVQPTGAHDSYPALDQGGNQTRVTHNGKNWRNSHGNGNSWAPGVFGWAEL